MTPSLMKGDKNGHMWVILVLYFRKERRTMYEARFQWWNKTEHDIIVLNAANVTYESGERFSNIRFINVPGINSYGMARGEAHSLLYLQKKVNLSQVEWVVKITAKYIVPNLTSYIQKRDCDMYVQSLGHTGARNSEIFAFRPSVGVFESLRRRDFSRCEHACWKCDNCFENWLHAFEKQKVTCHFPRINIDATWRTPRTHGGALGYL